VSKKIIKGCTGFTLIELMVGIAILVIISAIALPNLNNFLIKMRVDNEISKLNRMILTARNTAVSMGQTVTLCPLATDNSCSDNWGGQLSVFIDLDDDNVFDLTDGETLVKVKAKITQIGQLQYSQSVPITYEATGLLSTTNGNFIFCPENNTDRNRGISISRNGRATVTSDLDDDGIDEFNATPLASIVCENQ
jgi:prepilin-type N-terminal cleavage/methylation domain-containing protein